MTRRFRRAVMPLALLATFAVSATALVAALRADRRVSSLDAALVDARSQVGLVSERNAQASARLRVLGARLQAVSHPLHASLAWPVDGAVTSPYGTRGSGWHPGVDIDAPAGSAVRPAAAGVVVAAGWDSGYGNRVVVDHGRGLATVYAHLASIGVAEQSLVTRASVLGAVGCSGTCSGTHLHFEVRLRGAASDPELWLPAQDDAVASLYFAG